MTESLFVYYKLWRLITSLKCKFTSKPYIDVLNWCLMCLNNLQDPLDKQTCDKRLNWWTPTTQHLNFPTRADMRLETRAAAWYPAPLCVWRLYQDITWFLTFTWSSTLSWRALISLYYTFTLSRQNVWVNWV